MYGYDLSRSDGCGDLIVTLARHFDHAVFSTGWKNTDAVTADLLTTLCSPNRFIRT